MVKGKTQKEILDLIRSKFNTREKIFQEMGWDKVRERQKLSFHIKKLKEKGLIEEYEKGLFRVSFSDEEIADKNKVSEFLRLMKSNVKPVKEEAFKEFQLFSIENKICNVDAYTFLVDALDNPDYSDFGVPIFIILDYIFLKIMGTKFEKDFLSVLNKNPEFFVKLVLDSSRKDFVRSSAMTNLVKIDQEKAIATAFHLMIDADGPRIINKNPDGDYSILPLSGTMFLMLRELSEKNLERAKKRAYLELENHQHDKGFTLQVLSAFLEVIRDIQYPKKKTKEELKEIGIELEEDD